MTKKIWLVLTFLLALVVPAVVEAEVRSEKICDAKLLATSTTTDCKYEDISWAKFFSYQMTCDSAGGSISVSVDWVAGSAGSTAYLAVPLFSTGVPMSQLMTAYATEGVWTPIASIQPPMSPIGTIRLTELLGSGDTICTVILHQGN